MNTRFLTGLIVGVLAVILFGVSKPQEDKVHYHANFALYVNGAQDKFDSFTFYEEVEACDIHEEDDVHGRAHMHDQKNHVVHVHAHGVSWGQFFANLRYGLTDNALETDAGVFVDGAGGNKLSFILNGTEVENIANQLIKSEDILLINYGNEDTPELLNRFNAIPRDAHQFNVTPDPSTCSGS